MMSRWKQQKAVSGLSSRVLSISRVQLDRQFPQGSRFPSRLSFFIFSSAPFSFHSSSLLFFTLPPPFLPLLPPPFLSPLPRTFVFSFLIVTP